MNVVDWVLLAAVIVFAWTGWRQGFVAGLLSFAGFILGGLVGAQLVPRLLEGRDLPDVGRAVLVAAGVFIAAILGQALTGLVGGWLRARITWHPVRILDNAAGAVLNVLALAVVAWLIASTVAMLPDGAVAREVRQSTLLARLDEAVPDVARDWFAAVRQTVSGSVFPRVFGGIGQFVEPGVAAPDAAVVTAPAVRAALESVVRVSGLAGDCGSQVTGSGFAYADNLVMTNAHVVAGVSEPTVQVDGEGPLLRASVVYFDPEVDVAVLQVPRLKAAALTFTPAAPAGAAAVVAGFPGGGPLRAGGARVGGAIDARGEDIYGGAGVVRQVYPLRGEVRPGNSGGPLLAADGTVYGVVFAASVDDPQVGYALTADQVSAAADAGRRASGSVSSGACRKVG
ncbi:MAG: MarP family serine protease [Actinomycetota bacterium]|nr:MAG: MarP family serine protease [Actinomycetota bacterium]